MSTLTSPARPGLSSEHLRRIGAYVEARSAIQCPPDKQYLFESRLRNVMRDFGIDNLFELAGRLNLSTSSLLGDAVVEAMTTNETSWFRDIHPFEALREGIIPDLVEMRAKDRRLSVWSAACSTGQEVYSLAMMLDLQFPQLASWNVSLHGTDLSDEVLRHARSGRYSALEVNRGLPAQYLARYMSRDGASYLVSEPIRRRTSFEKLNLISPMPQRASYDLVLCRNVLIYFDADTRARVVRRLRDSLVPGGYLMLGSSEISLGNVDGFTRRVFGRTTVYRKDQR
jgi:chemotaxis protein methyltransferase CheR